jgi:hypothetical protein
VTFDDRPDLQAMVMRLTALTCLELAAYSQPHDHCSRGCGVLAAACSLTQLESLRLRGDGVSNVKQLPDELGGLRLLRCLELRKFHFKGVSPAICQLTRLEVLILLSPAPKHPGQGEGYPLSPEGIGALVRLRELRVSFHFRPVQELASPPWRCWRWTCIPTLTMTVTLNTTDETPHSSVCFYARKSPCCKTACQIR